MCPNDLQNKEEVNVWLSTYHEALRSPHTGNLPGNYYVIHFAKECADVAVKKMRESYYDPSDV